MAASGQEAEGGKGPGATPAAIAPLTLPAQVNRPPDVGGDPSASPYWSHRQKITSVELQAIATIRKTIKPAATVDDATLREKVISQLDQQPLTWRSLINVIVHDGTAELWGMVDSELEKRAVRVAAETTPGVRALAVT